MSFKNYIKEIEESKVFPSDEQIKDVAIVADESFWKTVIEEFKNKIESKDLISPNEKMKEFRKIQQEVIKEWLKSNWNEPDDLNKNKPKVSEFKGGVVKFEQPKSSGGAGQEPSTGTATTSTPEARI